MAFGDGAKPRPPRPQRVRDRFRRGGHGDAARLRLLALHHVEDGRDRPSPRARRRQHRRQRRPPSITDTERASWMLNEQKAQVYMQQGYQAALHPRRYRGTGGVRHQRRCTFRHRSEAGGGQRLAATVNNDGGTTAFA